MRTSLVTAAGACLALLGPVAAMPADAAHRPATRSPVIYRTVAHGLHNPRGVTFASTGAMYVAEAGKGGSGPCLLGGGGTTVCFGRTGSVMRVQHGRQHRVLQGLASLADPASGQSALGPSGVVAVGTHTLVVSFGFGTSPAKRRRLPAVGRGELAHLVTFDLRTGRRGDLGDLGRFERLANPVDVRDTNPTGVVRAGRLGYLVTDSGGNTLVRARGGSVSRVAAFHDRTQGGHRYQSVPTDVVRGPDGAYYVSELTGSPYLPGAARIWRVVPGHRPRVWARGLTCVTSLAFSGHRLYAVQIADKGLADPSGPVGSLRRVFPASSGRAPKAVATGLFAPYGLAIHRGAAYVSIGSVQPRDGSVIRVPLP